MQRYFCQLTCLYVFNIESLNIKTRGRLQITLFLTDACSQPIADIGQAKQDDNQKQTRNHDDPPGFRHQCFIRQ